MKIVNIFGGPGIGKSTFASHLFIDLKVCSKFNVELITEFAKDCVYEQNLATLKYDQLYLLANQNHRIKMIQEYKPNVDIVITDSPLILSNIYGEINNSIDENFKTFTESLFNSYDNINIFINRHLNRKYESYGRIQTSEESMEIHKKIKSYLDDNKIKYHTIDVGFGFKEAHKRFNEILKEEFDK